MALGTVWNAEQACRTSGEICLCHGDGAWHTVKCVRPRPRGTSGSCVPKARYSHPKVLPLAQCVNALRDTVWQCLRPPDTRGAPLARRQARARPPAQAKAQVAAQVVLQALTCARRRRRRTDPRHGGRGRGARGDAARRDGG